MAVRVEIHNRSLQTRKRAITGWSIPANEKQALLQFVEELELGRVNKGKRISESRQTKYLDVLRPPLEFFQKPTNRIRVEDVERFEKALGSGQIQSNRKQSYSHATKVDIRRALKVYLRWRLGKEKADPLVDWLDTRDKAKTPDYLKESEIEQLYKACSSSEQRFLIAILFDTGARAGEFHNIRYEDVNLPQANDSHIRITLKEEYSKTKGRTISLYWKHSSEAVRDYLREREVKGIRTTDPVFNNSYESARFFLHRLGKKVLGRSIHFHLFRHSSATFYASQMNRQQLCIRYGWAFSSRMPDIYISRAGVDSKDLDQKFSATEIEGYKNRLAKVDRKS